MFDMKVSRFVLLPALAFATPASAQDNQSAILDALKRIEGRLDGMDKRIDGLEKSAPATAVIPDDVTVAPKAEAAKSSLPPAQGAALPPGMKAVPGWSVNVIPFDKGNPKPDPLFRFRAEKFPLKFNAHLATRKVNNWVKYLGEAKFNAYESGRYIFQIDMIAASNQESYCVPKFGIDGKPLIALEKDHRFDINQGEIETASGGIDLSQGNYDVEFEVACISGNRLDQGYLGIGNSLRNDFPSWQESGFSVLVRGPNDDVARPFASKELFTLVKAEPAATPQKSKAETKSSAQPSTKSADKALPWAPKE